MATLSAAVYWRCASTIGQLEADLSRTYRLDLAKRRLFGTLGRRTCMCVFSNGRSCVQNIGKLVFCKGTDVPRIDKSGFKILPDSVRTVSYDGRSMLTYRSDVFHWYIEPILERYLLPHPTWDNNPQLYDFIRQRKMFAFQIMRVSDPKWYRGYICSDEVNSQVPFENILPYQYADMPRCTAPGTAYEASFDNKRGSKPL